MEDQVFGEIISDKKICKYIFETILSFKIKEIYYPEKQKEVKDPKHRERKDVRFDILVEDYEHNLYDVEAQTTDKKDLGWRMRYYAAKMDQRYTLDKGKTYRNMKKAYLIFLCNFDPEGEGRIKYTYHTYEDHNKSKQFQDGLEKIIINGKGIPNGENADQVGLVNLINDRPVHLNAIFDEIQTRIKDMNEDPEWRDKMIDYETRMLEKEQEAEEKGMQKGMQQCMQKGMQQCMQRGIASATVSGIKKLIAALKDFGCNDEQILNRLEKDYGDQFSIDELKDFMKQA